MNYYVKVETKDREFLVFKVIGADSQENAERIIRKSMGEAFLQKETTEGFSSICSLSRDFGTGDRP